MNECGKNQSKDVHFMGALVHFSLHLFVGLNLMTGLS